MADPYSTPPGGSASPGFAFNKPTIVALLYLAGTLLTAGALTIVGLILAYVWKSDVEAPWMASHLSFHIRTFWYSAAFIVAGVVTAIIGVGFLILALVGLYVIVRSVLALLEAQKGRAIADPAALFW